MTAEADPPLAPESIAAQAGHYLDEASGAIVPPIHLATTFARDADYALRLPSSYSRYGTPGWDTVEATLAHLEGGAGAFQERARRLRVRLER